MSLNDLHFPPHNSAEYEPPAPPKPKSGSRRLVRLAIFFAMGILIRLLWPVISPDSADPEPQPPAWAGQTAPPALVIAPDRVVPMITTVRLTTPGRLGSLPPLKNKTADRMRDQIETNMRAAAAEMMVLEEIAYGVYGSPGTVRAFGAIKSEGDIPNPALLMATAVATLPSWGFTLVGDFKHLYNSKLGGTVKCADGKLSNLPTAICLWVDEQTFGMVLFYNQKAFDVRTAFTQVREQIEVRS